MKRIYISLFLLLSYFLTGFSQNLTGVRICVNPGHGGFDSDDRNIPIYPFKTGDTAGFWESQSNLDKGLYLRDLLVKANADVIITRETNFTSDDLKLTVIVEMSNAFNSDYMLSIHSNAGVNNYILMLYSGRDPGDTHIYHTPVTPANEAVSREVSEIVARNLYTNEVSCWFSAPSIRGDKTFGRLAMDNWGDGYGVLRGLAGPGLLSEGAMHDYIPETYRLMNMDYKKMEAWNFFKSFCEYFEGGEQTFGKVAGWVKDKWDNFNDGFPEPQKYHYQRNTADEFMPLNETKVSLLSMDEKTVLKEYTTDNMYNGFFMLDSIVPGNYKIKLEREYYDTQIKDVTVVANKITYANTYLDKDRSQPMAVKSYSPDASIDLVSCGAHIKFNFNFEVDPQSMEESFSISPNVAGKFNYEKYQRIAIFVPDDVLDVNTEYTVHLSKDLQHIGGVGMENDLTFKFTTKPNNTFELLDHYPKNGDTDIYPNPMFKFYFDDQLMKSFPNSQLFSIVDESGNEFSQSTIEINDYPGELGSYSFTSKLSPNTKYTVKMNAGVKSEDSLFIKNDLVFSFTTGTTSVYQDRQIDDFEEKNLFVIDQDKTWNIDSEVTFMSRYNNMALTGSRSYQLYYVFTDDDAKLTLSYVNTPGFVVNQDVIGLYLYGDLSYNTINLIISNNDEIKEIPIAEMNFVGWKFNQVEIIGLPDGLHYDIIGFSLVSSGTSYSKGGRILFDNLIKYVDFGDKIEDSFNDIAIRLFPNPVDNEFTVFYKEGSQKATLQLFSLDGILQKECNLLSNPHSVNISELSQGHYIVRLQTEYGHYQTILIKQ